MGTYNWYGTRVMLVLNLPAFENEKCTAYDRFHGNGPYGEIPTKKEPIRRLGFTSRLPCHIIIIIISLLQKYFFISGLPFPLIAESAAVDILILYLT